jgi:two-component system, sensor histidine kinase YesM
MNSRPFHSLYNRLIIILIVLALLPLMILGGIGYRHFSNIMFEMIAESNLQTVKQVESKIEGVFAEINDILIKTSIHPDIQSIIKNVPSSDWEAFQESRFFVNYTHLLLIGNNEIDKISVLNYEGKRIDSEGHFLHTEYSAIPEMYPLMGEQLKIGAKSWVVSPIYEERGKYIVSIGKNVLDLLTGKPIGFVVVDLKIDALQAELKKVNLLNSGRIVLLNDQGYVVYHPSAATGNLLEATWEGPKSSPMKAYYLDQQEGEQFLYLQTRIEPIHWNLYGVVPYAEIQKEMLSIRYKFFWFAIAVVAALTIVAISIRNMFVKPIVKLKHLMRRVQSGDFYVRAHFSRNDEFGELSNSFNQMVIQIKELIEKVYQVQLNESRALLFQKQAELEALQANITPHFLHNTLHSISWLANRKGVREIQAVVDSLSSILRYSLTHHPKMVRLFDEFEYLQLYMEIIRFRYGNLIHFSCDLPSTLQDVMIPRLSLQPIVENAIKHAFENINGGESIHISATNEDANVLIEVSDNGRGMTRESLEYLNKMLTEIKQGSVWNGNEGEVGGMGILNVHYRIQLWFGESYGVRLLSGEDRGTRVRLNIPLHFEIQAVHE